MLVAVRLQGHFFVHSQARDLAGNADSDVLFEWYVDTSTPQPPVFVASPNGVSTDTTAKFTVQVTGKHSNWQPPVLAVVSLDFG